MLQTISDIRETLEEKAPAQNENEVEMHHQGGFGLHTQIPQGIANQEEIVENQSFKELREKFQQKLEEKVEQIHQFGEQEDYNE